MKLPGLPWTLWVLLEIPSSKDTSCICCLAMGAVSVSAFSLS